MVETAFIKTLAEASPWAALLALTLWRFDLFNNRLITENRDREERLMVPPWKLTRFLFLWPR